MTRNVSLMQDVPMVLLLNRCTAAFALGTLLTVFAGCPSSNQKPAAVESRSSAKTPLPQAEAFPPASPSPDTEPSPSPRRSAANVPNIPPKPPADEFQQPASPPPNVTLPKLKPGADSVSAAPPAIPSTPQPPILAAPRAPNSEVGLPPRAPAAAKSKEPPSPSNKSKLPFDPIKENGTIFDGWPRPRLALVVTGMEHGYLEPCGCAGLDRMMGGMSRRDTFFQQLRQKHWPVIGLDVGGLAQGFGRQAEMKFQILVDGKRKMGYQAITFGADDLRLPAGDLISVAGGDAAGNPGPFVAANVGLFGFAAKATPTERIFEVGGMKIGVTGVLGRSYQKDIHSDEIEMSDPAAALEKIVPELKRKADVLVLLAHASRAETIALAKKFPEFRFVVTSDGMPVPPKSPETIDGTKTWLITVGHKGMHAVVLGLFDDSREPVRYQRVPLDSRFPASADMKALMAAYQDQLKMIGFAGLGLRPAAHPQAETNGALVGSKKCESCHEISYNIWKKSKHAKAYETLQKADPPRNFDPECVSCHVVGWHPNQFFPYRTGYESLEKTPHLTGVGCEDCHGPGEKHLAAELGNNEELQKKFRKAVAVTKEESKKRQCLSCHDLDNSPDFNFDTYWPIIEHKEKE